MGNAPPVTKPVPTSPKTPSSPCAWALALHSVASSHASSGPAPSHAGPYTSRTSGGASSDSTAYPFATRNRKDFDNLLAVYLDAVFFPRLDALDFAANAALVRDAELAQVFELVAPKLKSHCVFGGRGEHIQDATAKRKLTALGDHVDSDVCLLDKLEGQLWQQVVATLDQLERSTFG